MEYHSRKGFALITSYFVSGNEERNAENLFCLRKNLLNTRIDRVYLIIEGNETPHLNLPIETAFFSKLNFVLLGRRPTFQDFIKQANSAIRDGFISIIANSDIYFDETLTLVKIHIGRSIFALTRWDLMADNSIVFYNNFKSQDAWISAKPFDESIGNYYQGKPGCDNRFLFELKEKGYHLRNPSLVIRAIHVHGSQVRPYETELIRKVIEPPYAYLLPRGFYQPFYLNFLKWMNKTKYNEHNYSLRDYYSARCRYYRSVWNNKLEAHDFGILNRVIAGFKMLCASLLLKRVKTD